MDQNRRCISTAELSGCRRCIPQREALFIIHQTERLTGVAVNETVVEYFGDDPRMTIDPRVDHPRPLTLDYVRPILDEWDKIQNPSK